MIIFVTKHVQVINNYSISNPAAKGRYFCQSSQFIGQLLISVAVKTPSCFLTNFKFEPRITLTKTVYLMGTIYDHIMKASIVQRLFMKFYHSCFDVFFYLNCTSLVVYMHNLFTIFLDHDMLSDNRYCWKLYDVLFMSSRYVCRCCCFLVIPKKPSIDLNNKSFIWLSRTLLVLITTLQCKKLKRV